MATEDRVRQLFDRDLLAQREMCADAIEFVINDERTPEPKLYEVLAEYDAELKRRGLTADGRALNELQASEDDMVARVTDSLGRQRVAGGGQGNAYAASEKQVNFLRKLLAERDLSGAGSKLGPITPPASLDGIGKKAASALIDRLLNAPVKAAERPSQPQNLPSEAQLRFIRKLMTEKDLDAVVFSPRADIEICGFTAWQGFVPSLNRRQASSVIDFLQTLPRKPEQPKAEIASGAYRVGDKIIRVYFGRQSRQQLAAELVDITATTRDEAWKYLGRADRFVPVGAHRLTAEEAEAINDNDADHGWCCVCGAYLDDPNSVRRGIGPVCRAKQGGE